MRILNVSAQKPDSTGSGVFLAQMARCMREAGHEVAVVCGAAPEDDPSSSLGPGVRVFPVRFETDELPFPVCGMSDVMPYRATRYRDMTPQMATRFKAAFSRAFREAGEAFRPDLVICHHLYLATAVARRAFPGCEVRAVSHSTDLRQMDQHGLERVFIVEGVRALDRILALHGEQVDDIVRIFGVPRERIRVIGTGYDARTFSLERRSPRGVLRAGGGMVAGAAADASAAALAAEAADAPVVGFAGRPLRLLAVGKVCFAKGMASLIEAVDALCARGVACSLDIAGGHSDEGEYARIVERAGACAAPVRFLGQLPPRDLADRYRAADVFVLPSFFEGLPLVIAEALACGCAVAASDLPGIRAFYEAFAPAAPIAYAEPPRMRDVDKPCPDDLPAFEARLADAIERAAALPDRSCDVSALSWERLTERALAG